MNIPQDQDSDDPWTLLPGSAAAGQSEPDRPVLQVDTIEGVEPLDTQIGVFPKKTVPDALHDALFGQPEPTAAEIKAAGGDPAAIPPMQTYAILDAAKVTNPLELLERSGLEHRCLFKGAAYDELKNVAPWIVRLEEGNAFTRNLFTRSDAHWHHWDKEPGICVRSRGTLDDMWKHFRKFTRVQDEDGNWLYWRFWDNPVNTTLISMGSSGEATELVVPLFGGGKIAAFVLRNGFGQWQHICWHGRAALPQKKPILTHDVRRLMRRLRQIFEFEKLARVSTCKVAERQRIDEAKAMASLRSRRDEFLSLGFWRRDHLAKICCWELMLGPDFIGRFESGRVKDIMLEAVTPEVRISKTEELLATVAQEKG
ncbi:DUF4123 domain-containing protein [Paracoccus aurantiacus]|nr:DUF4123 domain-containing protein [Paracoccus aurantiacus]